MSGEEAAASPVVEQPNVEEENGKEENKEKKEKKGKEEKKGIANHGGYTYWKRSIDDAHILPPCTPQKIDPTSTAPTGPAGGLSAWNTLGTWEERNVSKRVESKLVQQLKRRELEVQTNGGIQLRRVTVSECEASICFVRSKPRFGYEVALNGTWKQSKGNSSGKFEVTGLTDHDDLPEVKFRLEETKDAFCSDSEGAEEEEEGVKSAVTSAMLVELNKQLSKLVKLTITEIGNELIASL